jgi:hypothetical protein
MLNLDKIYFRWLFIFLEISRGGGISHNWISEAEHFVNPEHNLGWTLNWSASIFCQTLKPLANDAGDVVLIPCVYPATCSKESGNSSKFLERKPVTSYPWRPKNQQQTNQRDGIIASHSTGWYN